MKTFITGANGYIGTRLVKRLLRDGHEVNVMIRNPKDATELVNKGAQLFSGDIFSDKKLLEGMQDCDVVFHLAAFAKPFSKDPDIPYRTNVEGTKSVLNSARKAGVKRVVVTSTAGTMGYSRTGGIVDENTNIDPDYHTEYERTKSISEKVSFAIAGDGLDVIVVNPSRVFGPGKLSKSNSITRIMKLYGQGLWRIVPGDGSAIGNYAFIDDVVEGHILAARNGKSGQRYILGGENVSFDDLFDTLGKAYGSKRKMIKVSAGNLKRIASFSGFFLELAGRPPLIPPNWIDKYLRNWNLSCNKAISDLSYTVTPFNKAIEETVKWMKTGKINE